MTGSNPSQSADNVLEVLLGADRKIATLSIAAGSESELTLTYEPSWVEQGFAVSPHLPLTGEFGHREVLHFLNNLLPEGKGLEAITTHTTISKNNTFGLIKAIGAETSGALSFRSATSARPTTAFRPVTENELTEKLRRFKQYDEPITVWDGKTRLSVAGVQDKLNLLQRGEELGFGEGNLCSNTIIKFETGKAPFIAANECFTMLLANQAGLPVPSVELKRFGDARALAVKRFDRKLSADHTQVFRRHVIDGCQATNLPPSYKYERQYGDEGEGIYIRDGVSFAKLSKVNTVNNIAYHTHLIRWMTFNLLVRNYDAHGKNISFFVRQQGLELAPFYDLVNIEAIIQAMRQPSNSGAMAQHYAMSIGDYEQGSAGNFNNPITAYMLADFANELGVSLARIQLVMRQTIRAVLESVDTAKQQTLEQNLAKAEIQHIDLCVLIIRQSAAELSQQVDLLPTVANLL